LQPVERFLGRFRMLSLNGLGMHGGIVEQGNSKFQRLWLGVSAEGSEDQPVVGVHSCSSKQQAVAFDELGARVCILFR
jgi:hypothetical protein